MTDTLEDRIDRRMDERLTTAGRRWQADQAPAAAPALDRVVEAPIPRPRWQLAAAAAAAVLVVGGGTLGLVHAAAGGGSAAPSGHPTAHRTSKPVRHGSPVRGYVVPYRAIKAGHVPIGHRVHGRYVTPYDAVYATGHIGGSLHPGDTLTFVATLHSSAPVSLHPCPNYTIAFGVGHGVTRRLNCAQVQYYASVPVSHGRMSNFRPILPADTPVSFRMRMRVPDLPGRQKVLWTLDGPHSLPGFYGIVRVTAR